MKNVFIVSKNTSFPNYLFVIIDQLYPQQCKLVPELSKAVDLIIIDSETISPSETKEYALDIPIVLFTYKVRPFIIQFTSRFDINGILTFSMEASEIMKTVQTALEKDIFYNEAMISMLFSNKTNEMVNKIDSLTDRENEILMLMIKDQTNEEIALSLDLSVRTVNAHKGNIMRKIGSKTTSGLIRILLDYSANFRNGL